MSSYNSIAWLPLCAGLTGLGLVASWFAMRRRGLTSGLRGAAWSLLPLAAYLTGSIEMFWKIGTAIGDFAASFVFRPKVWSGLAVAGVAVVLFVVSGAAKRRRKRAQAAGAPEADGAPAGTRQGQELEPGRSTAPRAGKRAGPGQPVPGTSPAKAGQAAPAGDDMREVEEILRRHGIS